MNENNYESTYENNPDIYLTPEAERIFSVCKGSEDILTSVFTPSALEAYRKYSERTADCPSELPDMPEGNPSDWTDEQMERVIKRVKLGERISL